MHVLEQVQRGAAAAVEEFDVVGLHVQRAAAGQPGDQGVQFGQARTAERALVVQGRLEFRQVRAQLGVGVAQQVGEAQLKLLP